MLLQEGASSGRPLPLGRSQARRQAPGALTVYPLRRAWAGVLAGGDAAAAWRARCNSRARSRRAARRSRCTAVLVF